MVKILNEPCVTVIETSRQLQGNGYLSYTSLAQSSVRFPWHNGMAFRTRARSGTLMQVILSTGQVRIQVSRSASPAYDLRGSQHLLFFKVTAAIFALI